MYVIKGSDNYSSPPLVDAEQVVAFLLALGIGVQYSTSYVEVADKNGAATFRHKNSVYTLKKK